MNKQIAKRVNYIADSFLQKKKKNFMWDVQKLFWNYTTEIRKCFVDDNEEITEVES